jgi:hypothetical protein
LGNLVLTPPPVAASEPPFAISKEVAFHAISGMYDNADPLLALLVGLQNIPEPSLNVVPPTPVT